MLDAHITDDYNNNSAGVAELADAADLKSAGAILVGSSPAPGTTPSCSTLLNTFSERGE